MRIEHKLSPAVAQYAQRALRQLAGIRQQYLAALGTAKELELAADAVRLALSQQLAIVQESEGLPAPVAPYRLSDDGTAMIGEIDQTNTLVHNSAWDKTADRNPERVNHE